MTLLRFMFRIWDYRWLTPLCIAATIMLPIGTEWYGTPSDGWRIFSWMLAPIPTIVLFVGAYAHMTRIHIMMLERRLREANRMRPYYTTEALESLIRNLRSDPWWEA